MCPSTEIIITVNETVEQVDITVNESVIEVPITISEATAGLSAYQIAVTQGFIGTEEEWIESLYIDASLYALKTELPTSQEIEYWNQKQPAGDYLVAEDIEGKVDKVTGKVLSTNDYTTAEKSKLAGIAAEANNYSHPASHDPSIITQNLNNRFVTDADKTFWNSKQEPGDYLVASDIANKVDKITGKGLSANDFTTVEKSKLSGIEDGANNYSHPVNHAASVITQDSSNRFVSDTEKSTWSGKQNSLVTLETYLSFETYASMVSYLTNPNCYEGQIATCKDREGIVYILNLPKTEWLDARFASIIMEDPPDEMFLTAFISTWKTDNMLEKWFDNGQNREKWLSGKFLYKEVTGISNNNQIRLPFASWGTYDCYVKWGDGTLSHITAYDQAEVLHTYSSPGTYTIQIAGTCIGWCFIDSQDRIKLLNISQWGILNPTAPYGGQFLGCQNMTCTATDVLDLTGITVFYATFAYCWSFNGGSIGNWDTSAITFMKYTFSCCYSFNADISNWNFSNVEQNLTSFMVMPNLSVENYDKLLISLSNQTLIPNKWVSFWGCWYSNVGLAARTALMSSPVNWDIMDDGCVDTLSINIIYYPFDVNKEAFIVVIDQNEKVVTEDCVLESGDNRIEINKYGLIHKPLIPFVYPPVTITATFPEITPVTCQIAW